MPKNLTQRDHTGTLIWKHAFICCYYVVLTCKSSIKRGESVAKFPQDNWEAPARASWLDSVFAVSQSGGSTFCAVKIRIFIHRSDHRSASGSSKYNVSSYYPKQEKILSWFQTKKWYPPRVFSPICWIEIFLSRKQSPLNRRCCFFSGGPKTPTPAGQVVSKERLLQSIENVASGVEPWTPEVRQGLGRMCGDFPRFWCQLCEQPPLFGKERHSLWMETCFFFKSTVPMGTR